MSIKPIVEIIDGDGYPEGSRVQGGCFEGGLMENAEVISYVSLAIAGVAILLTLMIERHARKARRNDEIAREKHEQEEKTRFAATSDMLEKITKALNVGQTHEVKLVEGVNLSFQSLASVAESTHSGWSPSDAAWLGGKMRPHNLSTYPEITDKAIAEGKRRDHAGSDGSPDD